MKTQRTNDSDRAASSDSLKLIRQIPEGEYNRDVEIVATEDGLRIDDYIVIPWEWIRGSAQILATPLDLQKPVSPDPAIAAPQSPASDSESS